MKLLNAKIIIITGHYGSGKTNLAINLTKDIHKSGCPVTLADLDIVNPYFRSADFEKQARTEGIGFIASDFVNSNLDVPSLSPALDAKIGGEGKLVIDVGGDDAGAYALGRYAHRLLETGYEMVYVVNAFRNLTKTPEEALALLRDIERASRLKATCIINNSNLSYQTTVGDAAGSLEYAEKIAVEAGLPLVATAIRSDLYKQLCDKTGYYPVDIHVTVPWNLN